MIRELKKLQTEIETAIQVYRRANQGKPAPILLKRYLNVLRHVELWERRGKFAKNKLAHYATKARYYKRKVGR